jgi:hypothetical protein
MTTRRASRRRRATLEALVVCIGVAGGASAAEAPVGLVAHYVITMTHVRVGELEWTVSFSNAGYVAAATGRASGVVSVLVRGEGSFSTRGAVAGGALRPAAARSEVSDDDGAYRTEMTFENGALARVEDRGDAPPADRIPVTQRLLRDVADPLSAMLVPAEGDAMARGNCGRTLKIYDGRRRYDLVLSFKRVDRIALARGYAGPALVCAVVLRPIAGYKADSLLVRYLAGKDDLEMWFAPIAGAPFLLPVRALMPTLVGTMEVAADAFVERRAEPAPVKPVDAATPTKPPEAAGAPTRPVEQTPLAPVKP